MDDFQTLCYRVNFELTLDLELNRSICWLNRKRKVVIKIDAPYDHKAANQVRKNSGEFRVIHQS